MSAPLMPCGLMLLAVFFQPGPTARALPLQVALESPWWENYDQKDRYICSGRNEIVLERNEAQASLIAGNQRSTLFRETSDSPGLRFRNGDTKLILQGDELTLERFPQTINCVRTDEV